MLVSNLLLLRLHLVLDREPFVILVLLCLQLDILLQLKLNVQICLLYTSPSPRDLSTSRMPSSA